MRKSLAILLVMSILSGIVFADIVQGTIPAPGESYVVIEDGSQTVATNYTRKFDVNRITGLGYTYGINDKWAVGVEAKMMTVMQKAGQADEYVRWGYEGSVPLTLVGEYAFGEVFGINMKAKARVMLFSRKQSLTEKGAAAVSAIPGVTAEEGEGVAIQDNAIGIYADKPCKLNDKLNWGFGVEYVASKYSADEALEFLFVDADRNALRLTLAANYDIQDDLTLYMNMTKKLNSDAVGTYDDDVSTTFSDNATLSDEYGIFTVGVKYDI